MLEWLQFGLTAVLLTIGLLAMCAGVLGSYKLKFVLNRMHAAGMIDTAGMLFCSLGLAVAAGWSVTAVKLMLAVVLLWCTSPVSSHLIARLVVSTEKNLKEHCSVSDSAIPTPAVADRAGDPEEFSASMEVKDE